MTLSKLTRRTAFRVAALFAVLFSVAVVAVFAALYLVISNALDDHLRAHVDEVRDTLIDVQEGSGFDALAKMVGRHAAVAESEEDIFLLVDNDGNYVAGNIRPIPRFSGWKTIPWRTLPLIGNWNTLRSSTAVIGRWTAVKGGHLFHGDGNGDINKAQAILLDGLGWGMLMTAFSAILGGLVLGLGAQNRVGAIETALDAVARGELDQRVPRSASGDDLDRVGARINTTLDRLQGLIGSLKQVSTDIAHDLKTPIGRVRQRLETAQSSATNVDDFKATIETSIGEIDGIVATFEALLGIAEIEGGARRARFTDVDLKPVLLNVADAFSAVAEDAGHRIITNLGGTNAATIRGDRELLTQLFSNLIENAIRHCSAGCDIRLELVHENGAPIVRISDNGPGIPASERDVVFRRLYRLEKSRTTPGSGLGLSLVAAITDLHEATVTLGDNKPGLIVTLRFPADGMTA